jgi:UDP-N-acetylmuramoylalanine--D-glutamate ligase
MSAFPATLFAGSRFAVVGLGRNGLPAARALAAMGAEVVGWDDHASSAALHPFPPGGEDGLTFRDPTDDIAGFDALVLSPGIPHKLPAPHRTAAAAIAAGIPVWSDAELLYRAARAAGSRARFVGITGTNGKSTTTALLAHIAATAGVPNAAGGNLGPAALSLPLLGHQGLYILEMSSYMLERIETIRFDAAVILNLSPDHLERHGNMSSYTAAKRRIFINRNANDIAVVGIDDALSRTVASEIDGVVRISGDQPADVWCDNGTLMDRDGPILPMAEARALPGSHNAQNAAAAAALALGLGIARADIARGIASFAGLPHRQQRVAVVDGVSYIDDSKATNADAAARALGCYDRLVWIAGGQAKAGGIAALAPFFPRVAHALLIGQDAPALAGQLGGVPHTMAGTLDAAVPMARDLARDTRSPVVLLSPACASFDQFTGFEARGLRFSALANAMEPR